MMRVLVLSAHKSWSA